jgi:hypothetical protein
MDQRSAQFVIDMDEKLTRYGERSLVSPRQKAWLTDLAVRGGLRIAGAQ